MDDDALSGGMKTYGRKEEEGGYIWGDIDALVKNHLKLRTIKKE
ncbi:hypothetical protein [Staphylococcus saprophyticus]|nr:hypothetical protein [Staphylococcus saprophyticus]